MGRVAKLWFRAACAFGLVAFGLVNSAGQEGKGVPKETRKAEAKAEPAKAAVNAVINLGARAAPNDQMVQQWEQHYGPQFRQLHRTEMHFLRLAAQPTRQQYETIAA